jgi:ABC-type glycerol-3-phosphate transport system substrate-binding protein
MKKLIALVLASLLALGGIAACNRDTKDTTAATTAKPTETAVVTESTEMETGLSGNLEVWSFTNELKTHAVAFKGYNPDVVLDYVEIPTDNNEFQNKVIASANTDECPDVVGLEAAFVKEFVEAEELLYDLSDLKSLADYLETYQNTIDVGTDPATGEIRAFSYQTTPGAVFYRRSIALEYFGTEDPEEVQAMMSDMTKFEEMAATLKEKSGGKVFMVASVDEFRNAYFSKRDQPWFVDDTLFIDPVIDELFEVAKTFRENGYEAQARQWQEAWFQGMNDTLADVDGNPIQVFTYFLPTWGLPYVLADNGPDTAGDWGCVAGPLPYQWGGTWVGVMKNAKNPELAKEFVKFVALNEENLTNWATGVYTNEYLNAIDPELVPLDAEAGISQAAGDFVSSKKVVDAITSQFDDSEMSAYLGGQNSYAGFAAAAPSVSARLFQGSDQRVQDILTEVINLYAAGEIDKDGAIQNFKDSVASDFPEYIVE